jgi:indolepyruvate ferredoxin oxidoreductase, beta subunit
VNSPNGVTGLVLVGVGGQGILLAAEVIARAAMLAGHQVKTNEVHGMAQRGGSVMAQIRFGPEVHSPLIAEGTAAALLAMEKIEALRNAHYIAPGGFGVVSAQQIIPVTVSSGGAVYPADADARLRQVFARLVLLDAVQIAQAIGEPRAANIVLVGALSAHLTLPAEVWPQAVGQSVKPKYRDINLRALDAGRQAAKLAVVRPASTPDA